MQGAAAAAADEHANGDAAMPAGLCLGMTLGTAMHAGLLFIVWLRTDWQVRVFMLLHS